MMPTASSESAPVRRLSLFLSRRSSSSFYYYLRCYCYIVACATARGDWFFFLGRKRARGMRFLFFPARVVFLSSLSLSDCGGILGARVRCSSSPSSSSSSLALVLVQRWLTLPAVYSFKQHSCSRDATSNQAQQQQQQLEALAETPSPSWTKNSVETRSWRPSRTRTASRRL